MKKIILSALLLATTVAFAQESKLSVSGSVDTYFKTNLNGTNLAEMGDESKEFLAPSTSFANASGFSLGMANVVIGYEGEKVGFVADLVYGPKGVDASNTVLNQLYAYWNVSESSTLTIGKFNTYLGYEVISPTGNFFYSTSYMFSNGPFSHSGLKLDVAVNDDFSYALAIMNSTDVTEDNPTGTYVLGGQLGYKGQFLNVRYGDEGADNDTFQIDYTGGFDLSDSFYLGINATHKSDNTDDEFYGAALYAQLAMSDSFSIGLRPEYFNQNDEAINALTLSANYKVAEGLIIIPELRVDNYEDDIALSPTDTGASLASFLVAAVYSF
jgi:hypothetical protein